MGCAHMDDHRACRVTSVHTLSTTTKRTEKNKCTAVAYVDHQAQTLLLTRVPTSTWRLSALPTQRTLALKEVTVQQFQTIRSCPSRSTSAVAKPGPCPTFSRISRTNQKTYGLREITSQIEKQPAHHARSTTNVHRFTHAENYAHCVSCDTNCFKTSGANLLKDSLNLLAQQRIRSNGLTELLLAFHPSCITSSRSSTFPDSLRSAQLYSIQFAFDQSSTRFQISPTRFQTRRDSASFGYLTPFDLTLDLWRSAFTDSIGQARSQPILLLQLLRLLKAFQRSWSGYCCCLLYCSGSIHQDVRHHASFTMFSCHLLLLLLS